MSSQAYKQCKRDSSNNHLLLDLQEYMINLTHFTTK